MTTIEQDSDVMVSVDVKLLRNGTVSILFNRSPECQACAATLLMVGALEEAKRVLLNRRSGQ